MKWTHTLTEPQGNLLIMSPSRVTADEKQVVDDSETKQVSAAIDTETKLLLEVHVYNCH
jgi:hypothetical protein